MTTDTVGGVLTYTVELLRGLSEDVRVVVATMGAPLTRHQRDSLLRAGAVAVHDGGHALEWMPEPWNEVQHAGDWLLELEGREQPDIVHLNGYAHGVLPWSVPRVIVGHSCVLSWWRAVHDQMAPQAWDRYRAAVGSGLHAADAVVAPTKAMLISLQDLYGEWPGDAMVIHNASTPQTSQERPVKEPFVLGAGRLWDEAKNLTALDRASEGLPWPVLVAGPLRSPSGSLGRADNVQALGELDAHELASVRRRAGVFAAPALYEPFGLAILEAAFDSCALVLGDIQSLRELWDGAARFVDPRDEQALHAILSELMRDAGQREQLGRAALQRAGRYRSATMSAAYRGLYTRLSARSRALA